MSTYLDHFDEHILVISTTRYYLGRRSMGVSSFTRRLAKAWGEIPEHTRRILRRDIEREFQRDDWARAEGKDMRFLGDDCDRKSWEDVREAWQKAEANNE